MSPSCSWQQTTVTPRRGEDLELAELELEPGDPLTYVYDFGDWIEHTVTVEAIVPPETGETYPREVGRRRRRPERRAR